MNTHQLRTQLAAVIVFGVLMGVSLQSAMPTINLSGRADGVLPAERREPVFEVLDRILNRADPAFPALIAELPDPFVYESRARFREDAVVVEEVEEEPEPEPEPERIELADDAVLERVAPVFTARITGTLQRGENVFLQLRGGDIIREGNVLPVTLPAVRPEPYMIGIGPISSREVTLILNEARLQIPLPGGRGGGVRLAPN